jgi:hypothetical protein
MEATANTVLCVWAALHFCERIIVPASLAVSMAKSVEGRLCLHKRDVIQVNTLTRLCCQHKSQLTGAYAQQCSML